jgi:hypothetical protein
MTEQELGKALLQAGSTENLGSLEGRRLTAATLDRDRRRIRRLGAVTLLFWLLGAGGISFVLYKLSVYVPQYMAFHEEKRGTRSTEDRQSFQESYMAGFQIGMIVVACSVAVLALAGLCTFLLVLDTRRATLRQINASLTLISERLGRLQDLREQERSGQPSPRAAHANQQRET